MVMRGALLGSIFVAGCAPTLVEGNMPNPARRTDHVESTQIWEIGPHKDNHQYQLTIGQWTDASLGLRIRIVETDRCADPKGYTYTLVDDHDVHTSFSAAGDATSTQQPGAVGKTLTVATLAGTFPAAIVPDTRSLVVQMRPIGGAACPSLDFKWTFQ